jgi:hypothetical protein
LLRWCSSAGAAEERLAKINQELMFMIGKRLSRTIVAALVLGCGVTAYTQQSQAQAGADTVAALKLSVQQGMGKARQYEWVETTIIRLKGEEKGRTQNRAFYGADGKVQKVSMAQPAQEEGRDRRAPVRDRVVERKTDDMTDYMQRAAALIHQYVPPDPARIQSASDAGRVAVSPQAGGNMRVAISQYLLEGDSFTVDMNPTTSTLLGLAVNSYLDDRDDAVTLAVQMRTLPDGALYAAETTLNATAKDITVVIQNSGHKPAAQ